MPDMKKVIKGLEICSELGSWHGCDCELNEAYKDCPYRGCETGCVVTIAKDAIALLKQHEGLLGIQQTADGITFVSTWTAQQGEARGLMLGKLAMHEWLKKELLYRGLLTNDIREVFDEAERQVAVKLE